jgi:hypothetical protein
MAGILGARSIAAKIMLRPMVALKKLHQNVATRGRECESQIVELSTLQETLRQSGKPIAHEKRLHTGAPTVSNDCV